MSCSHTATERRFACATSVQLGFKQGKWIAGIELVADIVEVGGGHGYSEDHEFLGYRQSI